MSSDAASLSVRPATGADLSAVAALLKAEGLPADDIAAADVRLWLVEDAKGRALACGGLELHGETALVRSLVTVPAARGKGLGARLLTRIETESAAAGAATAWLLTTGNGALFRRHGYTAADRQTAPAAIQTTRQFSGLCPSTAGLYAKSLQP